MAVSLLPEQQEYRAVDRWTHVSRPFNEFRTCGTDYDGVVLEGMMLSRLRDSDVLLRSYPGDLLFDFNFLNRCGVGDYLWTVTTSGTQLICLSNLERHNQSHLYAALSYGDRDTVEFWLLRCEYVRPISSDTGMAQHIGQVEKVSAGFVQVLIDNFDKLITYYLPSDEQLGIGEDYEEVLDNFLSALSIP